MQAKTTAKPHAKQNEKAAAPYPSIITQVNKEDEKKFQLSKFLNFNKCCSYVWKCLPTKRKQSFNQITEVANALLDPQDPKFKGKKTLVLDLDETLVHSTFEPVVNPDLILPVKIQGNTYKINVIIRPGTEEFLRRVGDLFEVVVFTASLAEYAEPLCEALDKTKVISGMLYRQHCTPMNGIYVKDLSLLGRNMKDIILIDNSPNSFLFQPENAYHIKNFFDDKTDRELVTLYHFLEDIVDVKDVRPIEQYRKQLEQQPNQKPKAKFFKVQNVENVPSEVVSIPTKQPLKLEEREKVYNIETEPDLRKDNVSGYHYINSQKAAPLTERISNDRPYWEAGSESSVDVGLPSPKESDALIDHRETDAYLETEKNGSTHNADKAQADPHAHSHNRPQPEIVDDKEIDGHDIEQVRYLTNIDNVNSPLGKHVKIEFGSV